MLVTHMNKIENIVDNSGTLTKQHIRDLFLKFGSDRLFGRSYVQNILGITASPASALFKKNVGTGADLSNERKVPF